MREISGEVRDGSVFLRLSGRIDSGNSAEAEKEIFRITEEAPSGPVEIDAEELEYISSAGLRVLLRLRRKHPKNPLNLRALFRNQLLEFVSDIHDGHRFNKDCRARRRLIVYDTRNH